MTISKGNILKLFVNDELATGGHVEYEAVTQPAYLSGLDIVGATPGDSYVMVILKVIK